MKGGGGLDGFDLGDGGMQFVMEDRSSLDGLPLSSSMTNSSYNSLNQLGMSLDDSAHSGRRTTPEIRPSPAVAADLAKAAELAEAARKAAAAEAEDVAAIEAEAQEVERRAAQAKAVKEEQRRRKEELDKRLPAPRTAGGVFSGAGHLLCFGEARNVFVYDRGMARIRHHTSSDSVASLASSGPGGAGRSGDGSSASFDGGGAAEATVVRTYADHLARRARMHERRRHSEKQRILDMMRVDAQVRECVHRPASPAP